MRSRRRDDFSVARVFLKLVWQNGEDEKRIRTPENKLKRLGEGNQQKNPWRSNCEYSNGSQ